jgi:hypothetical protein
MLNARIPFLSASQHPILNTRTAAPADEMAGALPPHPRDFPLWGRQHEGAHIRHNMPTPETSDTMLAPPWRIGQLRRRNPSAIGGPIRHGRRLRTPPAFFPGIRAGRLQRRNPTPAGGPMRKISGVRGQSPCHHNRQRSCPCIFFDGPVANPALRRVGLGHWRLSTRRAARLATAAGRRFAGWRGAARLRSLLHCH